MSTGPNKEPAPVGIGEVVWVIGCA
jgi:hypothetical protein